MIVRQIAHTKPVEVERLDAIDRIILYTSGRWQLSRYLVVRYNSLLFSHVATHCNLYRRPAQQRCVVAFGQRFAIERHNPVAPFQPCLVGRASLYGIEYMSHIVALYRSHIKFHTVTILWRSDGAGG